MARHPDEESCERRQSRSSVSPADASRGTTFPPSSSPGSLAAAPACRNGQIGLRTIGSAPTSSRPLTSTLGPRTTRRWSVEPPVSHLASGGGSRGWTVILRGPRAAPFNTSDCDASLHTCTRVISNFASRHGFNGTSMACPSTPYSHTWTGPAGSHLTAPASAPLDLLRDEQVDRVRSESIS